MITVAFLIFDVTLRAGTERAVVNVCAALGERPGYRLLILSADSAPGSRPGFALPETVEVEHLNLGGIKGRGRKYSALVRRCAQVIRERKIDVLAGTAHALNCLLPLMGGDAKKVACEHLNYTACPAQARLVRRLVYPRLDAVALLTDADAARYGFVPEGKRYVIPNIGGFFPPEAAALTEKRMLAVGRLTEQKGFDRLLTVIHTVRGEIPGWTVEIFGAGEEKASLEAQIAALNLGDMVRLHEPAENIRREYLRSSVFLLPSRWEGLPMALIEAQSCGLPAVCFDCPEGPADIITDGQTGFLVENGDLDAFGRAVCRLAKSPELRREMGEKALRDAARFSPERVAGKWEALFAAVLDGGERKRGESDA